MCRPSIPGIPQEIRKDQLINILQSRDYWESSRYTNTLSLLLSVNFATQKRCKSSNHPVEYYGKIPPLPNSKLKICLCLFPTRFRCLPMPGWLIRKKSTQDTSVSRGPLFTTSSRSRPVRGSSFF